MRLRLRAIGLVGMLFLVGCQSVCGIPEPPQGVEGAYELAVLVPDEAEVVVYAEQLSDLLDVMGEVWELSPVDLPGVGDGGDWARIGAKVEGPGLAFYSGGQVVVSAWVDPQQGERIGEGWEVEDGRRREEVKVGGRGARGWQEIGEDGRWRGWLATDRRRLVAGWAVGDGQEPLVAQVFRVEEDVRGDHAEMGSFVEELGRERPPVHGVIRGGALMGRSKGAGVAGGLWGLLAEQVGEVFWAAYGVDDGEQVVFELWTPGDGSGGLVGDLGEAHGPLPHIGGLARQGVPAIVRLSADPKALLNLLKLAIGPDDRRRLEEGLGAMKEELRVDIEGEVIENLVGQFGLVVYGLEDSFFETDGEELLASLFRLQATREALLVPIRERGRMEDFFNIWTQISQGSLRRQALEHTVQYAWFDEGSLSWAVILSDDYLLFVDSSVAFGYALSWERSPSRLSGVLEARGVEELMGATQGIGAYVDLAALREVLVEGGEPGVARWLEGLEAVSLESDLEGRRDRARVRLWRSSPEVLSRDEE